MNGKDQAFDEPAARFVAEPLGRAAAAKKKRSPGMPQL
jgi:hypothetical protein